MDFYTVDSVHTANNDDYKIIFGIRDIWPQQQVLIVIKKH
jgi:hypothetical protein